MSASTPAREQQRAKGELRLAIVLVLLGAALAYLAGGRDWVDVTVAAAPPLPPVDRQLAGSDVVTALRPLALLGLAAVAALAATRRRGRIAVGAVVAVAGLGAIVATVTALAGGSLSALRRNPEPGVPDVTGAEPGFTPWWLLAVAGGLLLLAGGLLVAVRGRRWAALSSRYDTPAARAQAPAPRPEVAAWDALDRGEDPTREDPGPTPRLGS